MAKYHNEAKTRLATAVALAAVTATALMGQVQLASMGLHYRTINNKTPSGVARAKRIARKRKNIRARGKK